jgi:hypothetical protein
LDGDGPQQLQPECDGDGGAGGEVKAPRQRN